MLGSQAAALVGVLCLGVLRAVPTWAQQCDSIPPAAVGLTDENGTPLHLLQPPVLVVKQFGDSNLYWLADGSYLSMFLVGETGVIVVDVPEFFFRTKPNMIEAIASVTKKPITHIVYSHFHKDHIGGTFQIVKAFPNVKIIAAEAAKEAIERVRARNPEDVRPLPTKTFTGKAQLDVYGKLESTDSVHEMGFKGLKMDSATKFHGDGDLIIYAPSHKVLYVVDLIFPGFSPFSRLAVSTDIGGFIDAHDTLLTFDFDHLVAGHINRLGTRKDVKVQKAFIGSIVKAVGKAMKEVKPGFDSTDPCYIASPFNGARDFSVKVAEQCFQEVKAEWEGKLGALETYLRDHCTAIQTYLTVD